MKKLVSSLLLGAMVLAFANVQARNVSEQEARQAAAHFYTINNGRYITASDLTFVHQIDNMKLGVAECYMYNVNGGGWIIMAASTAIDPVVAFSEEDQLPDTYSSLPANVRWWLDGYAGMIGEVQVADAERNFADMDEWGELLRKDAEYSPKSVVTRYLIRTKWDQGQPNRPSYNMLCPMEDGRYCYTGCVATAMAQIIRYWETPIQPTGSKRYIWMGHNNQEIALRYDTIRFDYSLMPQSLFDNQGHLTASDEEVYQVALLSYACGVSVKMDYDAVDGSGAQSGDVPDAMHYRFRYVKSTLISRSGNNDTAFIGRIRRNLLNACPIYMSGYSNIGQDAHAAGHAWVCGGYRIDDENPQNEKYYYMNWGWGGTGNGMYNLVSNTQNDMYINGMGYSFTEGHRAIVGLYPASADSTVVNFLGIPEVEDNTELYSAYPNPATLNVTLPYEITSSADMVIYTIDGKTVETRSLKPGKGSVKLNVSNMPAGIYIYRIGGKSGKFMVQ